MFCEDKSNSAHSACSQILTAGQNPHSSFSLCLEASSFFKSSECVVLSLEPHMNFTNTTLNICLNRVRICHNTVILTIVFSQHLYWHGRCFCNVQSKINMLYAQNVPLLLCFKRNSSGSIRNQTNYFQELFE